MLYLLILLSQYNPTGTAYSPSYTFLTFSTLKDSLSISLLKNLNASLVNQGYNRGFTIVDAVGQIDNLLNAKAEAKKNFVSMIIEERPLSSMGKISIRLYYVYSYSRMPSYENTYNIVSNYDSLAVNILSDLKMYFQNKAQSFAEKINKGSHLSYGGALLVALSQAYTYDGSAHYKNLVGGFSFFLRYWQKSSGVFLDIKGFDHPGAPLWIIDIVKLARSKNSVVYYGGGIGISGSRDVLMNVRMGTVVFENGIVTAFPEVNLGITNNEDLPYFVTFEIGIGFSSTLNFF